MIWWVIAGLVVIFISGLVITIRGIKSLVKEHQFIFDYREKFIELANLYHQRKSLNPELYNWLIAKSIKAQSTLGLFGKIHYMGSYYRPVNIPNYEVISNTLPQVRTGAVREDDLLLCDDLMMRYIGRQEDLIEQAQKNLKNPFIWFQLGVQFYLAFPLHLLNWFGIISTRSVNHALSNRFFKFVSGIVGLVTFISGLVTIFVGWDKSVELIKKLLQ